MKEPTSPSSKAQCPIPTPNPILIVGAGPTGLVLAIWLRKKGVAVRIIDKSSKPGETSRALAVQARTLEFYRQMGIADPVIDAGITVSEAILRRGGKIAARAQLGAMGKDLSPFPYLLFCSQDVHEGVLVEELDRLGTQVERETELLSLTQDAHGVDARVINRGKNREEVVRASYLCGCDGAHSLVRHEIKSAFPGGTYSQVFYVADVIAQGDAANAGLQISVSAKDFCIVMPIKSQGSTRLTGIVPPESESKEKIEIADVAASVEQNTGLKIQKVNWFSTYHVHHRVAERFHKGRVFIAGDAGHIHSPAGGQGMNTGIGDAINLAWKLADVIAGRRSQKILETYEPERMAFARTLVATTDTAFQLIASRSMIGSAFRAYFLPKVFATLVRLRPALKLMFRTISQTRIEYRQSSLSQGQARQVLGSVQAGDRLPWVRTADGDNYSPLKAMDWQAHVYGGIAPELRSELNEVNIPLTQFKWNTETEKSGLKQNRVYVVRPDGHIGLIAETAAAIREYMDAIA